MIYTLGIWAGMLGKYKINKVITETNEKNRKTNKLGYLFDIIWPISINEVM